MTTHPLTAGLDAGSVHGPSAALPARLRQLAVNLLVALLAVCASLGAGELFVRLVAPQQLILKRPDVWVGVDTLGWVQRPDQRTTVNTGERIVRVFTDKDGFRVGSAGRVEGKKRVLLLGDSFMEAFQVEYEQSLAGLLETRLAQRFHEPVAIRNTGVGGWDPPQYLLQERRALPREHFDLVLVALYLGNDVVAWRSDRIPARQPVEVHSLRLPRRIGYREFVDAVLYPINDWLEARSQLFIFMKRRSATLLMRLGLTAEEFPVELLRREAASPRWSVTAQICRDIRDAAQARGVPTLFVFIPAPFQVDTAAFAQAVHGFKIDPLTVDLDQPERLLSDAMRPHRLDVLDVLPAFRRARQAGEALYGTVDRHLSPAGHALLGQLVEPAVAARLASHAAE